MTHAVRIVTHAASALLGLALFANAASVPLDLRDVDAVHGDATAGKTKAAVCLACHGAEGTAAVVTFPNLAGQTVDYLYWALVAFKGGSRPESPMASQVAKLDDQDLRDLAAWFASLPPSRGAPNADADAATAQLFRKGDAAAGVPPCQACHGAQADGRPEGAPAFASTYPALRGQHAAYLSRRLLDYRAGVPSWSSNDRVMHGVARTLDDDSINRLARWLEAGPK